MKDLSYSLGKRFPPPSQLAAGSPWFSILMSRRFYANVLVKYAKTSKAVGPLINAVETTQKQLVDEFSEIRNGPEDAVLSGNRLSDECHKLEERER